ncbi:aminotransferase class I/II-fold pyridoxal phosphate-dependent enzyme [Diaminobutyricibacter tongyongensis]|uniref:cysteine-S-conjugate beta-lyase n=1 Tax=Leifsonia tongyongensis TaxID=1268043 RepID=A0A6L9XT04_9MICO|nr:aminotransferase class I/II-fold pyridoxal phosphate-dependent enzyme [Diaminobutyricibacter tongyongensis]NEN04437.1 aminotransferase class I/II-fold pyridoxal phosphate-dependent enzyme [Diaminobutyricibacter tongyongensis]
MRVEAESLSELRQRTSEKWRTFPPDVLPLFVAEMDYPLAEPIADALIAAVKRSDTGYIGPGDELQRAFCSFAGRHWGWSVQPGQVTTTTDVSVVIVEALRLVIRPGDGVVINPPVYPPFFDLVPEAGGRIVEVPLVDGGDRGPRLDLDGIERAFAAGARAFLLCNPHNPVGLVHSETDLRAVADLAERYDVAVVSDEIHAPLTHSDATFTPFLAVSESARRHGIAAHSASKAWNLAGLKCALMVTAHDMMAARVATLPKEVEVRTSLFGRIASTAAFENGEEWLAGMLASVESNRARLRRLLGERLPGVVCREPHASYLAWLDFRALGWGDDPSAHALDAAKVALVAGTDFGTPGRGFARLNFACSPEVLTEAIERLASVTGSNARPGYRR